MNVPNFLDVTYHGWGGGYTYSKCVCLWLYAPFQNFSLMWKHHHNW